MSSPAHPARRALLAAALAVPAIAASDSGVALGLPTPSAAGSPPPARLTAAGLTDGVSFRTAIGLLPPGRIGPSATPTRGVTARQRRALAAMIAAANRIAHRPYVYGGGHGSFDSAGYDCSGSVSYVLHAAGLLATPADSSGLESFGAPGPGRHVTIYANSGHVLMTIDSRRFDTIAFQQAGTRWASTRGSVSGYIVRHPQGM